MYRNSERNMYRNSDCVQIVSGISFRAFGCDLGERARKNSSTLGLDDTSTIRPACHTTIERTSISLIQLNFKCLFISSGLRLSEFPWNAGFFIIFCWMLDTQKAKNERITTAASLAGDENSR
jgi:hypothetical protein